MYKHNILFNNNSKYLKLSKEKDDYER